MSAEAAQPATVFPVTLSVTDPVLADRDSNRLSNGKYAEGSGIYNRADNELTTQLHVTTPYLFVSAVGTVTTTVYADTPWGPYPLWEVEHKLEACGLWVPGCSSSPAETWTDQPDWTEAQKIKQHASFIRTTVTVS